MIRPAGLKALQGILSVYQNIEQQKVPFPSVSAYLNKSAGEALYAANVQILDASGRLFLSSVWRTPEEQFTRWLDWALGKKASYSPPPGESMHECGMAIDIDTRPSQIKIGHADVRKILMKNGWQPVVELGEPGDNHYEYRTKLLKSEHEANGYKSMVALAFKGSKYQSVKYNGIDKEESDPRLSWL